MLETKEKRLHLFLAILFTSLGVFIAGDLILLTHRDMDQDDVLQTQISCNSKLINVLRDRSNARSIVDKTTIDAQESLIALLQDVQENGGFQPNDPHVIETIRRYGIAAQARENPDLSKPYVDCSGKEIK